MTQVYRVWLAMQLTPAEAEEFRVLVKDARTLGWTDAELGQRIGFDHNPAKRMDQVMKRRKSALGEHLKALREVVSSREAPPSKRKGTPDEVTSRPPTKPRWTYAPAPEPRLPGEPVREREPVPDLSAPAPRGPAVSEEEALEFLVKVDELYDRGWGSKQLSTHLGFADSTLSAAYSGIEKKPPSRPLLDAVREMHASGAMPPVRTGRVGRRRPGNRPASAVPTPVSAPAAPVPGDAPGRAAPVQPPQPEATVREVVTPVEQVPDRATPVVRPRSTDSLSVLDYLERARDEAQRARKALEDAERAAKSAASRGNKWIRRGIEEEALPLFAPLCTGLDNLIHALTLE